MLEAINVIEHLHWPEIDMAKKCVLEKSVSGDQVYGEQWSSGALNLLSDCRVILQNEIEEDHKNHRHHSYQRTKRSHIFTSTYQHSNPLILLRSGCHSSRNETPVNLRSTSNLSILGSPISLSPRLLSRTDRPFLTPIKLSQLAETGRNGETSMKKLSILTAIKPSNVDREKAKFFHSGFTYNPQFEYSNAVSAEVLEKNSKASDRFLIQAVRIMELALHKYGSYEKFEQVTGGNLLTKSRIQAHVRKYMEKEGCVGEITVQLSDGLLSRASMTVVNGKPTLTINTTTAREHWLEGMLRHEIGTHYFRGINHLQQPWGSCAGRKKFCLKPLNPTEEGLASIHSVLFRRDPMLWRAALLYYTIHQASLMSFTKLFCQLEYFVHDPFTRWDYCVRAKRGQIDTSLPGCFNKDQVYLDGILKLLRHREKIDFQLLIALGKVSYEDVDRLKDKAMMAHVRIPHFLQDQARYAEQLQKIMVFNQLNDEELHALI